MAMSGAPINWATVSQVSIDGKLMGLLNTLPYERWTEYGPDKRTFLHVAALGANVPACVALVKGGMDVNPLDRSCSTPVDWAVVCCNLRMAEVLVAAGSKLRSFRFWDMPRCRLFTAARLPCVRVLIANGLRLATLNERITQPVPPELREFERGVLQCRSACVALLALHKRGRNLMSTVGCKYMAREIALAVYATRATFL